MKKMNLKVISLLLISLFFIGIANTNAQIGQMQGKGFGKNCNIPDLTEEQQKKIDILKVEHQRRMLTNRNLLQEKKARLRTLSTAEKADMKAINGIIDEIGVLQTKMMKDKEAHHQSIRSLLNDNQRLYFDNHRGRNGKGKGMGNGMRHGHHRKGNCQGR